MINKTNTAQGTNVEHLFCNSIFDHPKAWGEILASLGRTGDANKKAHAEVVGGNKRKADVEITFADGTPPIRVNVKSFSAGFNHLERRNLVEFCNRNQIGKSDANFLKDMWLRKAVQQNGKGLLVHPAEQKRTRTIFSKIEPGVSAFLGNDHPQILALYHLPESKWRLYNMDKQVIPLVRGQPVRFTKQAGNIEIGEYVAIQRKGSASGENGKSLSEIGHGANHVQIKMKVTRFWKRVEPATWYQL